MKKALLISHHNYLDAGYVSDILYNSQYSLTIINSHNIFLLNNAEIKSFNLVCFFGGRASANDNLSSIKAELFLINKLSKFKIPTIGICLGAQLIAKFFGSKILNNSVNKSEIGYKQIMKPNIKYFKKSNLNFMQFHNQGISPNSSMEVLAHGRSFEIDAFKIKNMPIFGFQFHPEVDSQSIYRWYKSNHEPISKYKDSLSKTIKNHESFKDINYLWLKKILLKVSS